MKGCELGWVGCPEEGGVTKEDFEEQEGLAQVTGAKGNTGENGF